MRAELGVYVRASRECQMSLYRFGDEQANPHEYTSLPRADAARTCRWERGEIFRELGQDDWRDSTVQDIGLVSSRPPPGPFLNGPGDARKWVTCAAAAGQY